MINSVSEDHLQGSRNKRLYVALDDKTDDVINDISLMLNQPKSSVLSSLLFEMLPYFKILKNQLKEAKQNRKRVLENAPFFKKMS